MKSPARLINAAVLAGLLLSACTTTGEPEVVAESPRPEGPGYRLTEKDVDVPSLSAFRMQPATMLYDHFGSPTLVRREGDAELRQYRIETPFGTCVLLAAVYDQRGYPLHIEHMAVRENGAPAAEPVHCLREFAFSHKMAAPGS